MKYRFYINNCTLDHPVALLIEEAASKSIKIFLSLSLIWQMTVGKMMFWYIWRLSVERWSFMIVIMVFTATTQSSQIVCEIAIKFLCLTLLLFFENFNEPRTLNDWISLRQPLPISQLTLPVGRWPNLILGDVKNSEYYSWKYVEENWN